MAKKSNKTAHVLNLLAGHDNAKETTEENVSEEVSPAEHTEADAGTTAAAASSADDTAAAASSVSAAAPAQNISLIDTTGEDPVAALIHEKLSSEFEEQMGEGTAAPVDTAIPAADTEKTDSESANITQQAAPIEPEVQQASQAQDASAVQQAPQIQDEPETPQAASVQEETAAQHPSVSETEAVSQASSQAEPDTAPQAPSQAEAEPHAPEPTSEAVQAAVPEPSPEPVQTAAPEPIPEAVQAAAPESTSEAVQAAAPEPSPEPVQTAAPEPEPVQPAAPEPEPEPDFAAVNVMERIVKDKIIYFMRQFDVCTCDRCVADTVAMTLNGLTPKYIVTTPAAVDPLLSYYTNRLISDVTVEATKACMIIKDNPRH